MLNKGIIEAVVVVSKDYNDPWKTRTNRASTQTKGLMSTLVSTAIKADLLNSQTSERVEVVVHKNKTYLKITSGYGKKAKYVEITATVKNEAFDLERELEIERELQLLDQQAKQMRAEKNRVAAQMQEQINLIANERSARLREYKKEKREKSKQARYGKWY